MNETYTLHVAGLTRELKKVRVAPNLRIASFVMLGDTRLIEKCADALYEEIKKLGTIEMLVCPEAKGIPLVYEMARQSGANKYFVARKGAKAYMQGVFSVDVRSITTMGVQHLVLDTEDAKLIRGKRMLLVDDVISTGESLHALETLVTEAGGIVAGRMAPLAEGDAAERSDIIYLAKLPLFNADGSIKA